jgi:hypothetical protein
MTLEYMTRRLRFIDPLVKLEEHPTIPMCLVCTPSAPDYVGYLIPAIEQERCMGILVFVNFLGQFRRVEVQIRIEPEVLTWRMRLARWIAGVS